MAKSLSPRELKQMKRDAADFARKAKAGVTYYYIDNGAPKIMHNFVWHIPLGEVVFQPSSRSSRFLGGDVPRWYGPLTAENAYMDLGPLYADRNDRAIRGMRTGREWQKVSDASADAYLASDEFAASVEAAAAGTRFKATFPQRKQAPKKAKKQKAKASR
jgi:hypothetical protein